MNLLDPSHFAACQAHFDTVRMGGRFCQDVADNAVRQTAAGLVLLEDDRYMKTAADIGSSGPFHRLRFRLVGEHFFDSVHGTEEKGVKDGIELRRFLIDHVERVQGEPLAVFQVFRLDLKRDGSECAYEVEYFFILFVVNVRQKVAAFAFAGAFLHQETDLLLENHFAPSDGATREFELAVFGTQRMWLGLADRFKQLKKKIVAAKRLGRSGKMFVEMLLGGIVEVVEIAHIGFFM